MPEGLDEARDAFAQELAVPTRPRDQAGRFVSSNKPEPIFQPRALEGGADGDTSDGGADPRLIERERRIADGRFEEGDAAGSRQEAPDQGRQARQSLRPDEAEGARHPAADDGHERQEDEPVEPDAAEPGDEEGADRPGEQEAGEEAGPKYEVTIDGQKKEITVQEAISGYQDLSNRYGQVREAAQAADAEMQRAVQIRDAYAQQLQVMEQEFQAILPKEPDWDALYKQDPAGAHDLQKNFQSLYGKLNEIRARRAQAVQEASQEYEARTAQYAKNEFARFVQDARIQDQPTLNKRLSHMRKTAADLGFSEAEIATVYDSRMLRVLDMAARYQNLMNNRPLPVVAGKGKTLAPGTTGRIGNSGRRGFDDAQVQLAKTGRLDDAAAVFQRMLR
jgi:hypothetical protein